MQNKHHGHPAHAPQGAAHHKHPLPVGAHHHHTTDSNFKLTTHATLHCLIGCAVGELAGLSIGVGLGFEPWATILLATVLGFMSGYLLGLWPLVRTGKSWSEAFRIIWLGETISIGVMELVMNTVDYSLGGVHATSVMSMQFWLGYLFALLAGFIAAWPVNYWLLSRELKQRCH